MLSGAALANPAANGPDPADPKLGVAALGFDTGLRAATAPAAIDPPARWREHNDRVRDAGGHRGLFKPSADAATQPSTSPHGGHK